jgi:hypothetical protein
LGEGGKAKGKRGKAKGEGGISRNLQRVSWRIHENVGDDSGMLKDRDAQRQGCSKTGMLKDIVGCSTQNCHRPFLENPFPLFPFPFPLLSPFAFRLLSLPLFAKIETVCLKKSAKENE